MSWRCENRWSEATSKFRQGNNTNPFSTSLSYVINCTCSARHHDVTVYLDLVWNVIHGLPIYHVVWSSLVCDGVVTMEFPVQASYEALLGITGWAGIFCDVMVQYFDFKGRIKRYIRVLLFAPRRLQSINSISISLNKAIFSIISRPNQSLKNNYQNVWLRPQGLHYKYVPLSLEHLEWYSR